MEFQEWWNNFYDAHNGDVCNIDPKDFALTVWNAARSAENQKRAASTNSDYTAARKTVRDFENRLYHLS